MHTLFLLHLLGIVFQQPHNRSFLELSRGYDVIGSWVSLAMLLVSEDIRTRCKHRLNEIPDIAQDDTKPLHRIRVSSFGFHRLDLDTLHDRFLHDASTGLEDTPITTVNDVVLCNVQKRTGWSLGE